MIIGIDPGYSGGIAFMRPSGEVVSLHTVPLDKDGDVNFIGLLQIMASVKGGDTIVIEDVHSIFGAAAKANFQFGRVCGILRAIAEFTGANIIMVPPKAWQSRIWEESDIVKKGKKRDTKATSLNAATRLYPDLDFRKSSKATKPHDGLVDAVLIARSYVNQ